MSPGMHSLWGFAHWQKFCWDTVDMPAGFLMEMMINPPETWKVAPRVLLNQYLGTALRPITPLGRAYEAPFPDASYKMGPRAMPSQVPTLPTDPLSRRKKRPGSFSCNSTSRFSACLPRTTR